jgi:RNA-directed DNA polymerase
MVAESRTANAAGKGGGSFGSRRGSEVPMKPGNAGGGKDPCFWNVWKEGKKQVIDESLETPDKVRELQIKLYRKAKSEPDFRFYLLYDKIHRADVLQRAWLLAKANDGAPGVDNESFEDIESKGLKEWLDGLGKELHDKTYRPQPVRRVMIPKPGGGERPLGIPTIRDRVAQTAAKLILEPIFEADFEPNAYGYRPGKSAQDAIQEVNELLYKGYTDVVDADLSKYLDTASYCPLVHEMCSNSSGC